MRDINTSEILIPGDLLEVIEDVDLPISETTGVTTIGGSIRQSFTAIPGDIIVYLGKIGNYGPMRVNIYKFKLINEDGEFPFFLRNLNSIENKVEKI